MKGSGKRLVALVAAGVGVLSGVCADPAGWNPYGVVTDASRSEYASKEMLADFTALGGMGYMRVDWDWWRCQPAPDAPCDFSFYDELVAVCEARNIRILPIVYGAPKWAAPAWKHAEAYAAFVGEMVRHYGSRVPVVEIWNEENVAAFWGGTPDPTNYVAMLRATYKAVKRANPNVRVAFGGASGWAHDFIRRCYEVGAADCFDIMNVHPYTFPFQAEGRLESGLAQLREIMSQHGDGSKPIWFTEIGWPTVNSVAGGGNFLAAGLKVARPEKKKWRLIYAACIPSDMEADQTVATGILKQLPPGSEVRMAGPEETCRLLADGSWDAVMYPPDESYPAQTYQAVLEFVRQGGTLVDLGGMPMWDGFLAHADGTTTRTPGPGDWERFSRLHIGLDSWWIEGSNLPKQEGYLRAMVTPEGLAAGIEPEPQGYFCRHFLSDKALRPGDKMVPLVTYKNDKDGKDVSAACVYLLDSELKGRIFLSGVVTKRGVAFATSEERQGILYARTLGIAFAEGVEAFFWYNLRARENSEDYSEDHFGMLHANCVPKPAWCANRNFITHRPPGSVNIKKAWTKGKMYAPQWKRPDGVISGMLWADAPDRQCKLTFATGKVSFTDVWGRPVFPGALADNEFGMSVGRSPIYFTGALLEKIR